MKQRTKSPLPPLKILTLLMLVNLAACSASRFESREPPFKVAFPTRPQTQKVDTPLPDGTTITEHIFVSLSPLGDRIVIAAALPPIVVEQLKLPGAAEANLGDRAGYEYRLQSRRSGKLLDFNMGKFGDRAARFTRYLAPTGSPEKPEEKMMLERSVYGPRHLYLQIFAFDPAEAYSFESPVARAYFDSFEIPGAVE